MDCSPEYVVGYYSDGDEENARNRDRVSKVTDREEKGKEIKSDGKFCQQHVANREMGKKLLQSDESSTTTLFPYTDQLKKSHAQLKRLFTAKRYWERKLRDQTKAEEEHQVVKDQRKNSAPLLVKETETLQQRNDVLEREIKSVQFDMEEDKKAAQSKINSVNILTGLYEQHKARTIKSMQSILDKLNAYDTELIGEQIELHNKLSQRWRFFGKSKLRREIQHIEKLRAKTECVAEKLQKEIDYMAEFKLSRE